MYDELVKRLRTATTLPVMNALCQEAADAIEELRADKAALYGTVTNLLEQIKDLGKPRWIPVTERLPKHGQEVLCACKAGIYEVFKYVDGISGPWYKDSRHVYMHGFVTHWMPLPEPPKEE